MNIIPHLHIYLQIISAQVSSIANANKIEANNTPIQSRAKGRLNDIIKVPHLPTKWLMTSIVTDKLTLHNANIYAALLDLATPAVSDRKNLPELCL